MASATNSELDEKLSQAGLDTGYWARILQTELNITSPLQIQYLDETDLEVLKGSFRQKWEEKALRKFIGIKTEPSSSRGPNDDKLKIIAKLNEAGLDGEYWADVLKTKLGVNRIEQIANLNIDDLRKLEDAAKHEWEKKALAKFLAISDQTYEDATEKLQEQHKQSLEKAKQLLQDVVEMRQKGAQRTNDKLNGKLDQMRKLMNVTKEEWIVDYDDKSLDDMISKMTSDLQDFDKLVEGRPECSPSEILTYASGGLALKGILLLGKASIDDCVKRTVLSTPTDVRLMSPLMNQVEDVVHFTNKAQSDHFNRSFDKMGYSVAASVKGGKYGVELEGGLSKKHEKEDYSESEYHQHTHFESRIMYSAIPTAACELNKYNLRLSQQALKELKDIDRVLAGSDNVKLVEGKCEDFLRSYGSHVNIGVLHFGGVNKFVATYKSETMSNSEKIQSMLHDALSAHVSSGFSPLGVKILNIGGSGDFDRLKQHGTSKANYTKEEPAIITLKTVRNGGPQEVSGLPLWKMGLITCNSTWALIDRGETLSTDSVGIWELIPNHKGEFKEPRNLESSLVKAWENMSGNLRQKDQMQSLIQGLDTIDMLVDKIAAWNSRPLPSDKCVEYLQEVLQIVEEVEAETGTNKYWIDKLCTEVCLSHFLSKVVELKDQLNPNDVPMIRFLIRKLVNPVGLKVPVFPGKHTIMTWAEVKQGVVDVPSILATTGIKSISDLIKNLKDKFLPTLYIKHGTNRDGNVQVRNNINAGATIDLARCVGQLLKDLQSSNRLHQMFFLNISLLSVHYNWSEFKFEKLLTMKEIGSFLQFIEVSWREFQIHNEKGKVQLEAYLINTLLTSGYIDQGKQSSEDEFSKIMKELRQVLSPQLNKVLNSYATDSPFNWIEMVRLTGELANGNMAMMADVEEKRVNIPYLHEALASQDKRKPCREPIEPYKPLFRVKGGFAETLTMLGLYEYYPSKISSLDVLIIKKASEHPTLVDLPWLIIQKLFLIDFHARDGVWDLVKTSQTGGNPVGEDGFDLDNFLKETQNSMDDDDTASLNTLDVLVAIFACCDNMLKQTLAEKLFVCKLAIPFLYPSGSDCNVMSLWALRTITVQWHSKHKENIETPVTDQPIPIVTFVRLGRPAISKSKLMNDILRDHSHDTFSHHDCNNGAIPRKLTDGLVECSWFTAGGTKEGNEKEHLPCTTMFLNLRGDASLMEKQMQVLQEISSVVFIVVTAQDLTRIQNTKVCQQIYRSGLKVILFLIGGSSKHELQTCFEALGKDFLKSVRIISSIRHGSQKNANELKTDARKQLSEVLAMSSGMVMDECARIAAQKGIIIDEYDDEACLEGRILAERVLRHMDGMEIVNCKQVLLPLQGDEWLEYCKLKKKQHRTSAKGAQSSSYYQSEQVRQQMDSIRKKQVEICDNSLTPFIKEFMSTLQKEQDLVLYFLKWMNMLLDEKTRANIPGLRRKYHALWAKFQEAKKKQEDTSMQHLKLQVDDAEHQLASASFGLENMFRELGQIYEALKESRKIGKETREVVEYLPEIAAKLLMKGIPLELVDGDAASIPISWVKAVLNKLGNVIGEKRLFVLSVLGIQSSGKSTLLNTMFGLKFAVSAGRCTRGAYMQLIPVDGNAELPFDYIVVVDTEGLRAPELGQLKHEHDNELATLVIGLGDVTILNIKGENTAEVKDTLQIAVHAFLRMNLVRKNMEDHRSCIFVHQNVPAANAEALMMHGCQKLQEELDDMVKEVAYSETIANIHSFSQIINFDVQKHVWYISDLWHGDPPMAPANPGYSKKVRAVRSTLLGDIVKGKTTFLTASDLSLRLEDLWNGVLADDFVFSFRNSLEMKAYTRLQSEYYLLEWELQKNQKDWLQKAEIKLKMSDTIGDLDNSFQSLIVNLSEVLTTKAENIKSRLDEYFEKSNLKDIIIQWQQSKLNQLDFAVQQLQIEGKKELLSINEGQRLEILQSQKWTTHEGHIMRKAVELAKQLKGKEVTDLDLQNRFESMWIPMVHELTTKTEEKALKIPPVMEEILFARLSSQSRAIKDEIWTNPLDRPPKCPFLEGSLTVDDITREHISLKEQNLWGNLKSKVHFTKDPEIQARHKTVQLTDKIFRGISAELKEIASRDTKFLRSHAIDVIYKLLSELDAYNQIAFNSAKCNFTILPRYRVKLAVHVSRYCIKVFNSMQRAYSKKHGVKGKLEVYKTTAWSLFKNTVKQSTEEVIAGDLLITQVKFVILKAVKARIPQECIEEVLRDFQMTKYYLIVKIMDDLALQENFKHYEAYIRNAKEFALSWVTQYTNEKIFSSKNERGISRYAELARINIVKIISCIAKSVEHATNAVEEQGVKRMTLWIDYFCNNISQEIAVPVSSLKLVGARKVVDFNNLKRIILDQLDTKVQTTLENEFKSETEDSIEWDGKPPSQQIVEKIWGCPEQCPFCNEPCSDTQVGHYSTESKRSHVCVQHRPQGVGGTYWSNDGEFEGVKHAKHELNVENCMYLVQRKDVNFRCMRSCTNKSQEDEKSSNNEPGVVRHPYTEYKTCLEDWDISPDSTNSVTKYWMWFMATYKHQLKDMHDRKTPSIPESWNSITKEQALEDLRKYHN